MSRFEIDENNAWCVMVTLGPGLPALHTGPGSWNGAVDALRRLESSSLGIGGYGYEMRIVNLATGEEAIG